MSVHIGARPGDIANTVLIAGDPLRARYAAEQFLERAVCYNQVRGMLGFTGYFNGKRVSIQGTGMGIPSTAIYVHELIDEFKVKSIIRVGTCGAIHKNISLGQIILAMSASSDSATNRIHFGGQDFAPTVSFELVKAAYEASMKLGIAPLVGPVFSTDTFYGMEPASRWKPWAEHGILACEMETSILYTLAARHRIDALTILTVSDNVITHEYATAEDREKKFMDMMKIALTVAPE